MGSDPRHRSAEADRRAHLGAPAKQAAAGKKVSDPHGLTPRNRACPRWTDPRRPGYVALCPIRSGPVPAQSKLEVLLAERGVLLADGATGTNLFAMGLEAGDPPEFWTEKQPAKIKALHQAFVDAGADIILTNTFGCNARRLMLHQAEARTGELNRLAAVLAREVADAAGRTVIVAGSVGPTGDLFDPLGVLTEEDAVAVFIDQIEGLKAGGADVIWIETMSALEEMRAAALAAAHVGMPFTITASFDTAGRTMMGITPEALALALAGFDVPPMAIGANCGVGASDTLAAILSISTATPDAIVISKANAGMPTLHGTHVHYSGTPELMGEYAKLAIAAGARIIGGCCGTSPEHLAAMRHAIDSFEACGTRPSHADIVRLTGAFVAPPANAPAEPRRRNRDGGA
jgi:methionine synthase I (cobalamin-dependent)